MGKKKYKLTKKIKAIDDFIKNSDDSIIAVSVFLNHCEPYGGVEKLISKNKTVVLYVIIQSMLEFGRLKRSTQN